MTFSGLHETVKRTPDSSDGDEDRLSRCADRESVSSSIAADVELVRRLLHREQVAWKEFNEQYQRLIYSRVLTTCQELGRDPRADIIEDCCSEVLAKLFEKNLAALRSFRGGSRLSTWLTVVTRRIALRYLLKTFRTIERTKQSDSRFDLQTVPEQIEATSDDADQTRKQLLEECLHELSTSDRKTLLLHSQENLSYEEIAKQLGITANAVGPKLARARKRLKKLVQKKQQSTDSSSTFPPNADDMK